MICSHIVASRKSNLKGNQTAAKVWNSGWSGSAHVVSPASAPMIIGGTRTKQRTRDGKSPQLCTLNGKKGKVRPHKPAFLLIARPNLYHRQQSERTCRAYASLLWRCQATYGSDAMPAMPLVVLMSPNEQPRVPASLIKPPVAPSFVCHSMRR